MILKNIFKGVFYFMRDLSNKLFYRISAVEELLKELDSDYILISKDGQNTILKQDFLDNNPSYNYFVKSILPYMNVKTTEKEKEEIIEDLNTKINKNNL
jgi:hypothetical protein